MNISAETISADSLRTARNLVQAFLEVSRRYPERVAVRDRGRDVTYRELTTRVRELTVGLVSHAAQDAAETAPAEVGQEIPGGVIAVATEPGSDAVAAVLAVMATGAAYLPLDPHAPTGYLTEVLNRAHARVVLVHGRQLNLARARCLDLDALTHSPATRPSRRPLTKTQRQDRTVPSTGSVPDDPACVIFTSGSTGQPKGVVVPHRALLYSTAARVDAYGVPHRVPLLHAATVDVHLGVMFWALLTGATLVIGPHGLADIAQTAALIRTERVTDLVYLSSLYPLLLDYTDQQPLPSLRRVMIGSDRWTEAVIDRHVTLLPGTHLHNEYGPTEAAVWTSQECVWNADTQQRQPLTIGRPVTGTGYRLLNPAASPIDPGPTNAGPRYAGELYITGAQLAIGYLGEPELSAARFVTLVDGERALRTGDLAAVTASGDVVLVGRVDRQLKVQGHRIEPGQVETVLMRHPAIALAHVMARTDRGPGAVLVAYLTPRHPDTPVPVDAVRAMITQALPLHLVPTGWLVLDELPRLTGGKIDEAALPAPTARISDSASDGPPGARRDEALPKWEGVVTGLVEEVLGRVSINAIQSLLEFGASSLALMQIASRLERDHGVAVPISALAGRPTIQAIAATVQAASRADRPALTPTPASADAGTPLSAQQLQVWYLTQLAPAARAYNTQCSLVLHGRLQVDALTEALAFVVARHEILRTTVHADPGGDGEPTQVVHQPWQPDLGVRDLTDLPDDQRDLVLDREIAELTEIVFDTSTLPLVRWRLFRTSEQAWVLIQVEHHFVHDGWSAVLLLREIRDAYAAYTEGGTPQMPELVVQYRDWAAWQRAWMRGRDAARQSQYWQTQLTGVAPHGVTFPPDFPRPARQGFSGARVSTDIPESTVDALDVLCGRFEVSRFTVFLAVFGLLVRQHTGSGAGEDVVVGSALANRTHPDVEPLLGMFVNALPMRLQVRPGDSIRQVVARTMQMVLGAQDHQEWPLIEIIKDLGLPRDSSRNPLFSLMFAFHDAPRPVFEAGGVTGRLRIDHNSSAKNDVNVVCVPRPPAPGTTKTHAGITVLWEYDRDLYEPATAEHLLASYARILHTLTDPDVWDRSATALEVLDPDQARQIVTAAAGPRVVPAYPLLDSGVRAQIRARPQQPAIQQGDQTITYEQLGAAATAIQIQLVGLGVGRGDRVAVACGPGPEHVAAVLAVLAQGAVFVCLDAGEPDVRLKEILADADPAVVVCSAHTPASSAVLAAGIPSVRTDEHGVTRLTRGGTGARVPTPRHQDHATPDSLVEMLESQRTTHDAAYLVYTSGATGAPKAVVATHTNAVTALTARTARNGAASTRTLITLPLQFDVASSMIFWTLWNGGTVVFPGRGDDQRDPVVVRELVERHRIRHINLVASFYRHVLATLPATWDSPLQTVAVGGEPCPPPVVREHARLLPGVVLDNEYGPTEATVWCTADRVYDPEQPAEHAGSSGVRVTVGAPLAGYRVYIVDELADGQLALVPIGALGELCVAGPGVTAGYRHQPELTNQRFVIPTTGPLAGMRLYRTGDRARLTTSGQIDLIGRLDEQVKIRGYRIELGDVRDQLCGHPAVTEACVLVDTTDDRSGDRDTRLLAYLAVAEPTPDLPARIRAWARDQMPGYMVPAVIIVLDRLPLTATGKIDRQALPHPVTPAEPRATHLHIAGHTSSAEDRTSPDSARPDTSSTHLELVLQVWRDVLGRTDISLDDDWFALGGDSLSAIRAAGRLSAHGAPITVTDLLHAGTARAVAARLDQPGEEALVVHATGPSTPADPRRRPGGTTIAFTAMHAWFFAQDFADPNHFTQAQLFTVPADTTLADLRDRLAVVVGRHEAFRTVFRRDRDGWAGYLLDDTPPVELTEHPVGPDHPAPPAAVLDPLHRGLDITGGPLWRAAVFTDTNTDRGLRWLYVVAHHLLVDAVSWDILAAELHLAHTQPDLLTPTAPALTAPRPLAPEEMSYWDSHCDSVGEWCAAQPTPALPAFGDPAADRARYDQLAHTEIELPADITSELQNLARRRGISMLAVLLAATHHALAPVTQGQGLHVLLESHGRHQLSNAGQIVGWLTSLYPVLLTDIPTGQESERPAGPGSPRRIPAQASVLAVADAFHHRLAAMPRGGRGFGAARYLAPDSDLGRQLADLPMPEVTVNYLGVRDTTTDHPTGTADTDQEVRVVAAPTGQAIGPANILPTALHITGRIDRGIAGDMLRIRLSSDPERLDAPALAEIATSLTAELTRPTRLQPLTDHPDHDAQRLYLVHPVDGEIHWYLGLATELGPRWDCYGLRAASVILDHDGDPVDDDPADLVTAAVTQVRQAQPTGPYSLAGWSFGAVLAYAIAEQLEAAGETIEHLLLLDPPRPNLDESGNPTTGTIDATTLTVHLIRLLADVSPRHIHQAVTEALAQPADRRLDILERHLQLGDDAFLAHRVRRLWRHHQWLARWTPTARVRSLQVVRPTTDDVRDSAEFWAALALTATAAHTPYDHHAMLSKPDAIRCLARLLEHMPTSSGHGGQDLT